MRRFVFLFLIPVFILMSTTGPVSGHAPLSPGENLNLADATVIPDPLKSWVVYGHLHDPGETAYFSLDMHQGDRLELALQVNTSDAPVPDLVVMGPGIVSSGIPQSSLEIPPGSGIQVISGTPPESAGYEAFSPSVIYQVASYSEIISEPGTYYAAVYNTGSELSYSFVAGYEEEFTAAEWLIIPLSLISIYSWEGQPSWFIAAPYLIVMFGGLVVLLWQQKRSGDTRTIQAWIASIAGLLYIGTGTTTLIQMFWVFSFTGYSPESLITIVFAVIPILLGLWALSLGRAHRPITITTRAALAVIGALGLVSWAGLIVGPILAFTAAVFPARKIHPVSEG
jgi:hypothetical protein